MSLVSEKAIAFVHALALAIGGTAFTTFIV
jgi:hypothetical protein